MPNLRLCSLVVFAIETRTSLCFWGILKVRIGLCCHAWVFLVQLIFSNPDHCVIFSNSDQMSTSGWAYIHTYTARAHTHRGFGRCASEMQQNCKLPRRVDDASEPIGIGAGSAFSEGLQLHAWSIIDQTIDGAILTSEPAISWLFVPASPKLLAPVTGLTAEVWPNFSDNFSHSEI
jgi:hypothetical protein